MTRREILTWVLTGLLLAPVGVLTNSEMVAWYACHRQVAQMAPALTPSFDPATFRCHATL